MWANLLDFGYLTKGTKNFTTYTLRNFSELKKIAKKKLAIYFYAHYDFIKLLENSQWPKHNNLFEITFSCDIFNNLGIFSNLFKILLLQIKIFKNVFSILYLYIKVNCKKSIDAKGPTIFYVIFHTYARVKKEVHRKPTLLHSAHLSGIAHTGSYCAS
jgi:hypothetical protein